MTTKRIAIAAIILAAIFFANRIAGAYMQCYAPTFSHSASCFVHDVLTGEDL